MTRTVTVALKANNVAFDAAMARSAGQVGHLGRSFDQVHANATRNLGGLVRASTIAEGIIGGTAAHVVISSVKAAMSFQKTMELVHTQAGASQAEVGRLSTEVLKLAPAVGSGPEKLAEALYHVESVGYRGAAAMAVLKQAAIGAKVGNADLDSTTYALTSVMNTFGTKASDAGKTMAQLNAIVGTGDMRMQDLNGAIGSGFLASADTFGISLQSAGAALAYLTDRGSKADESATRLKMSFALLGAPTKQSAKLLEGIGISTQEVHARTSAMSEALKKAGLTTLKLSSDLKQPNGIGVALQDLKQHLADSGLSAEQSAALIARAFGGGRSGAAIMSLYAHLDVLKQKFDAQGKAAAAFGDDWAKTQQTAAYNSDKFKASLDEVSIRFGSMLLPKVTQVTNYLSGHAIPAVAGFIDGMQKGTGPGGQFATTLSEIGDAAKVAWDVASPLLHFVVDHPQMFGEIAKDALIFAGAMKAMGAVNNLRAKFGGGGALGAATTSGPVPVFVTNMGPGGMGGEPGVPGTPGLPSTPNKPKMSSLVGPVVITATVETVLSVAGDLKDNHRVNKALDAIDKSSRQGAQALAQARAAAEAMAQREATYLHSQGAHGSPQQLIDQQTHYNRGDKTASGAHYLPTTSSELARALKLVDKYDAEIRRINVRAANDDLAQNQAVLREKEIATKRSTDAMAAIVIGSGGKAGHGFSNKLSEGIDDGLRHTRAEIDRLNGVRITPQVDQTPITRALDKVHDLDRSIRGLPDHTVQITANIGVTGMTNLAGKIDLGTDRRKALGGLITGPGTGTSDSVPILASNGEFVVRESVARRNLAFLTALNSGSIRPAQYGGGYTPAAAAAAAGSTNPLAGGLHIHGDFNVHQLPGERLEQSAPRALSDLLYLQSS